MTKPINESDLAELASKMGVPSLVSTVKHMLDQLWVDVVGSDDIGDDHPRFGEHVGMLSFATVRWDDLQTRLDEVRWDQCDEANAIERAAIRRIVTQVLHM